ncbi:hypothetical protein Oscil6304_0416 [Oscillatoria acuminata PCC 6304]|uniref:Uncharacterized protein n=1 Tax=Oscillatoria acuminata PCC 6304 TaxID=56110 RepID=K9TDF8_9CYAN|nr:hypothetical protein Oscil6304_0416 [Oscillatoria acuminata PCC 6304]
MWESIGLLKPQTHWISLIVPSGADPGIVKVGFELHGTSLRIYSRILIRQVFADGDGWLRSQSILVFPDFNNQAITFPLNQGDLRFVEIRRTWRSWRWRNIKDASHLVRISVFIPS